MRSSPARSDTQLQARVLAHYGLVGPLMEASLLHSPIVFANYPEGLEEPAVHHITTVPFTQTKLPWLIHAKYAMSFFTWAPLAQDSDRLRFGRIVLDGHETSFERVKSAAIALRDVLREKAGWECVALIDGGNGMALWIPFADAPHAAVVRERLHELCGQAIARYPNVISGEANTHSDGRVHVYVSSDAARRYSAAPYSLQAPNLTVCAPVRWEELESIATAAAFTDRDFPSRLEKVGDLFATMAGEIAPQHLTPPLQTMANTPASGGRVILAGIEILSDGVARTAEELLDEALKRHLLTNETKRAYVYTALTEYIARQIAYKRCAPFLQDERRRFHINEPPDDWPDITPEPRDEAQALALCDRLDITANGDDPEAFEIAVCDAFAHLGFLTQHIGGTGAPGGVADAILGPLAYRVTIECVTSKHPANQARTPEETAKLRDAHRAQFGVLVGPEFSTELELLDELRNHRVTAISVADLQTLLHIDATAKEIRTLLVPGCCSDGIERALGAPPRRRKARRHDRTPPRSGRLARPANRGATGCVALRLASDAGRRHALGRRRAGRRRKRPKLHPRRRRASLRVDHRSHRRTGRLDR
jgi:DNA primase